VNWWDYSRYRKQTVNTNPDVSAVFDASRVMNYKDSYQLDLGLRYGISRRTDIMVGLMYDWSPIPDEAYAIENAASDNFVYSLGLRHRLRRPVTVALAWRHNFFKDQRIDSVNYSPNLRPIGEAVMYQLSFDVSYRF
jgi:long-subunit fatty acid transport protein